MKNQDPLIDLGLDWAANDLVRIACDRKTAARMVRRIIRFLENPYGRNMLEDLFWKVAGETEDLALVGGPLNGKVITVTITATIGENMTTFLIPKNGSTPWAYSKDSWDVSDHDRMHCHIYGNRKGAKLFCLEDA